MAHSYFQNIIRHTLTAVLIFSIVQSSPQFFLIFLRFFLPFYLLRFSLVESTIATPHSMSTLEIMKRLSDEDAGSKDTE